MESQFTIAMFVCDHMQSDWPGELYLIHPETPTDISEIDSHGFFLADGLPILYPLYEKPNLLPSASMFQLGSIIYFFGGKNERPPTLINHIPWYDVSEDRKLAVWAFDTKNPEFGFSPVTPLNAPKERPCVFAGHGKLYALGSNLSRYPCYETEPPTGNFERYDPKSKKWEILPDPPEPFRDFLHINLSVYRPIVIHPLVFIHHKSYFACFNLDTEKWVPSPSEEVVPPAWSLKLYPFSPVYCRKYLYSLQFEQGSYWARDPACAFPLSIVKGPVNIQRKDRDKLEPPQLVATNEQLDGHNALYNYDDAQPRRHLYHVGHKVFCYIVDSPLIFLGEPLGYHGIWIKFFKEVQVNNSIEFRLLGSFCYKINHPFKLDSISFCFFGSVPIAWKEGVPLNQKVLWSHEVFQAKKNVVSESSKLQGP